jgi:hypothetical protein
MELNDENVREFISKTLPKALYLCNEGVVTTPYKPLGFNYDTVKRLLNIIPKIYQKHEKKKFWNCNSYTAKNNLEQFISQKYELNIYIANGECILALLLLGYEYKSVYSDLPNLTFNCTFRNINKERCACGLMVMKFSRQQHLRTAIHQTLMEAALQNNHIDDTDTEFNDYLEETIERLL